MAKKRAGLRSDLSIVRGVLHTCRVCTAGCNGRFFGPRACSLGRVQVGRHRFAGLENTAAAATAQVEVPPMVVSTGRLLLTVGGTGGVRVGVIGDQTLSLEQSSVLANVTEAEVTWAGGGSFAKYKTGAAGLWLELEPGAILYALHM
jgi:hypothetical protein